MHWLVDLLRDIATLGTQCWPLSLAGWIFSSSSSHTSFGEWEPVSLCCIWLKCTSPGLPDDPDSFPDTQPPSYRRLLFGLSHLTAWHMWQNSNHDEKFRSQDHYMFYHLVTRAGVCQTLFFKWSIILWCWWYIFAPETYGPTLWISYSGFQ